MKKITRFFLLAVAIAASVSMANANTECAGTSTAGSTFTLGYNYSFTTVGTDVTITFELLDQKVGVVPQLVTPTNVFTNMSVSGQKGTYTLHNQTIGTVINYACFFAFSGGAARTVNYAYTVGNQCSGTDNVKPVMVSAVLVGTPTSASAKLLLSATDNITNPVTLFQATDAANGINATLTADASGNAKITGLKATTTYNLKIQAIDGAPNFSDNSIIVTFTTGVDTGVDFETSETGADWGWTTFEGVPQANFEITANPSTTGINTSATCAKFTVQAGAGDWAGLQTAKGDISLILSSTNAVAKMMVYKSNIGKIGIKLSTLSDWARDPIFVTNTKINEWEELTFDFTPYIGSFSDLHEAYDRFAIHFNTGPGTNVASINYIDNIIFGTRTTGISEVQAASFTMYPTFTKGKCVVSADSEIAQIVVRNIMGQTVQTISGKDSQANLDLTSCAAGNYFVTVKLTNGKIGTQKIIRL